MRFRFPVSVTTFLAILMMLGLGAEGARAQSSGFQAFFFAVCQGGSPISDLAARCQDSDSSVGEGQLSSDSTSSLNPDQASSNQDTATEDARVRQQGVQGRLEARRDAIGFAKAGFPGGRAPHLATASPAPFAALGLEGMSALAGDDGGFFDRFSLLIAGRGVVYDRDASSNERGYEGFFAGPQIGADYRVSDKLVVGSFFSYDKLDETFDEAASNATFLAFNDEGTRTGHNYFFTIFGSYNITDALYADMNLGGGWSDTSFRRNVSFQPGNDGNPSIASQVPVNTQADVDGNQFTVEGGLGYGMYFGGFLIDPYARARYIDSHVESYNESAGNGLQMRFPSQTQKSLTTILGLRGSYAWSTAFGVVVPQVRFEWEHEFENDRVRTSTTYLQDLAGTPFGFVGDSPDRDYFNLGGGFVVVLPGGLMPYFDFQALLGYSNLERYRFSGGLRFEL